LRVVFNSTVRLPARANTSWQQDSRLHSECNL
jgi:hypothetical protein